MAKLISFLLVSPLVIVVALIIGLPLVVYNYWAWPTVGLWFIEGYMYTYFPNFPRINLNDLRVAMLGMGIIYSLWWGMRYTIKDIRTGDEKDSTPGSILVGIFLALAGPWLMKLLVIFVAWWYAL